MAEGRPSGSEKYTPAPDLDFETSDPSPRQHTSSFTLQMIMELQRAHGSLTAAVSGIQKSVDAHGAKLDILTDIRGDLREIVTKINFFEVEQKELKTKIEKVHHWVIGATAILAAFVVLVQIGLRYWPASTPNIAVNAPPLNAPAGANSNPLQKR